MKRYLLLLVLLLGATACIPPYQGKEGGPLAAAWGDSIMGLNAEEIPPVLTDKYQVSLDWRSGWTLNELQGMAKEYADTNPDNVIISAGTNDAYEAQEPWNGLVELARIGQTIDLYPKAKCIAWINLNEQLPTHPVTGVVAAPHAVGFNAALDYWHTQRTSLRIIDFNAALDYFGRPNLLLYDGVHLNETGQGLLAYLVRYTLDTGGCA